eukprot:scaffold753_cov320-Prasinococcus_capsulatus_cf.AAC.7
MSKESDEGGLARWFGGEGRPPRPRPRRVALPAPHRLLTYLEASRGWSPAVRGDAVTAARPVAAAGARYQSNATPSIRPSDHPPAAAAPCPPPSHARSRGLAAGPRARVGTVRTRLPSHGARGVPERR